MSYETADTTEVLKQIIEFKGRNLSKLFYTTPKMWGKGCFVVFDKTNGNHKINLIQFMNDETGEVTYLYLHNYIKSKNNLTPLRVIGAVMEVALMHEGELLIDWPEALVEDLNLLVDGIYSAKNGNMRGETYNNYIDVRDGVSKYFGIKVEDFKNTDWDSLDATNF